MQHHPGFSCPLCRTFGDLEADVEQDDLPEPIEEASSSSSSESGSEDEDENENAPSLPEKDLPASASVNAALASEHTAVQSTSTANAGSSDPNLDTLRPGRRSPMVPSVSEFGSTASASTSPAAPVSAAQAGTSTSARASPRPSLDVVRPASPRRASGAKTPPSRGSRVSSSRHVPPSGAAVAAALEPHITTPHNHHHHHHHHHSQHSGNGDAAFSPPSAGDFDPDIRRGSIYVHGADGHAMHIPITGRSRPGSVHEAELSSDAHHHHLHSHNQQSPSVTTAEKNKARSVRSMRMTKSKTSMTSLKNAAATGSPSHGPSASTSGHRRRPSAPSSEDEAGGRGDDDTSPMDIEEPLTARPMPGAISAPGQYPFPDANRETTSTASGNATGRDEDVVMEDEHDTTPPMSNKEDSEETSDTNNAASHAKGKGKATRSDSSSTQRNAVQPLQPMGATDASKASREEPSASVHAIV